MSFGLPSVKAKPEQPESFGFKDTEFGITNLFTDGFTTDRCLGAQHPLHHSEANFQKNRHNLNMVILRNTQGLHAPLKIGMELKAASKVGRLPFLPSSNVMLESLTGRDLEIGPEDLFNTSEFREVAGQPHAVVERSLGML